LIDNSQRDPQRGVNRGISGSEVAYSTISQTIHAADSKSMRQNKNARMPIVSLLFMLIFDSAGFLRIARVAAVQREWEIKGGPTPICHLAPSPWQFVWHLRALSRRYLGPVLQDAQQPSKGSVWGALIGKQLPAVSNGLGRPEHTHNPIRAARHVWAMCDADASHPKLAQTLVDEPFIIDIEVRGALVKEKNMGLSIQSARKQHPLFLASR
jgi:hypothetical protein